MSLATVPPRHDDDRTASLLSIYTTRCTGGHGGHGLESFLPRGRTTLFGFARQALAEALRRVGVDRGDIVLLPAFICREVLAGLAEVGAVVRFYDIDETLRTDAAVLDRAAPSGARAVVVVNYFGFPQPLDVFRRWSERVGASLIEDNAHGLLSSDGGVPLGRRGDFGLFSFRKTLAVPNGAALVDNQPDDAAGTLPLYMRLYMRRARGAEWRYRAKTVMKILMGAVGVRGSRALIDGARLARRVVSGAPVAGNSAESERAMPDEALAPLTTRLLARLDVDAEIERRRRLYRQCQQWLRGVPHLRPIFDELAPGVVPQGFPFFFTGADPTQFIADWWREGVPMIRWPDLPLAVVAGALEHYRRVMLVPFLW